MRIALGAFMARAFLTARWCNLFLANYPVPADLLRPLLPPGLDLDLLDGQPYVSLVAFQFLETRVLGIPWPGYRDFPEVNLRFYVRHGDERGVVFVREFVPQRLVAWIARVLYNEPYQATGMTGTIREQPDRISAEYTLDWGGRRHTFAVTGGKPAVLPGPDSVEQHFKEHFWGFGTTRGGQLMRYGVEHPPWQVYPVLDYRLDLDTAILYGPEWGLLGKATPASTVFAVGSGIRVLGGQAVKLVRRQG